MSTSTVAEMATKVGAARFQSALRKLSQQGADALKPQLVVTSSAMDERFWMPPAISKRKANVLRKQALAEGTYGSFDGTRGWDPAWDVEMARSKSQGQGRIRMRVPKSTTRQRTREQRAVKIERAMEGMDERIEQYYEDKQDAKPERTFENYYKQLMRVKK